MLIEVNFSCEEKKLCVKLRNCDETLKLVGYSGAKRHNPSQANRSTHYIYLCTKKVMSPCNKLIARCQKLGAQTPQAKCKCTPFI